MKAYSLILYVTGQTSRGEFALNNLRKLCESVVPGNYEIAVIDVLEWPQRAEDDKILATPTLIKSFPPPKRRLVGDLSDSEKVLMILDIAA